MQPYIRYSQAATALGMGSCYGSVGKPVTSNFRGPQFESSHRQNFILHIYCQMYWRAKNKEKEVGNGPFLKKLHLVFGDWQSSAFFRSKLILMSRIPFSSTLLHLSLFLKNYCVYFLATFEEIGLLFILLSGHTVHCQPYLWNVNTFT